jgi:hypothetical protein
LLHIWKNVNNKEGTKNYRRLRNELKRAKEKYLESICDKIIEFQRTGHYVLMYMKTKELGWKENHGIQHWHRRLSREYDNRSEKSTANLGEFISQSSMIELINQNT